MNAHQRILQLREAIRQYDYNYYVLNVSQITDADYDKFYRELVDLEVEHPEFSDSSSPTQRIGAESKSKTGFKKVQHSDARMLSLDNMRSAADVLKYFGPVEVVMEPKIDGASLKLIYSEGKLIQAITRGNGSEGDDVTVNARAIKSVPLELSAPVDIVVTGEVYMTFKTFNVLNQKLEGDGEELMANPRNATAGAIKLKDPKQVAARKLKFVAYGSTTEFSDIVTQTELIQLLEDLGFQSPRMLPTITDADISICDRFVVGEDEKELSSVIEQAGAQRKYLDLPTDGLVLKLNDLATQRELGEGTKYPNYACAYKFPPERKETQLIGVTIQIGRTGRVTPVAELKPVQLGGTIVRRASLCNQNEIDRLGVGVGDIVIVSKSCEIIPKIDGVAKKDSEGSYRLPELCPCCETKLIRPEGFVDSYCPNKKCSDQVLATLKHACGKSALDIDGCGEALIQEIMAHGVTRLSHVFELNPEFMKASARNRFNTARALSAKQPLWRKLHALGIDGFGQTLCQDVSAKWSSLSDAFVKPEELLDLVGEVVYDAIVDYISNNGDEIDALDKHISLSSSEVAAGPLKGKSFCITGDLMTGTRSEVSRRIEKAGGTVKSSVSRHLSYLIQGTETGRTKREAAEKHGIPIISENELFRLMGEKMPVSKIVDEEEKEY